jgi:hypothetical protein
MFKKISTRQVVIALAVVVIIYMLCNPSPPTMGKKSNVFYTRVPLRTHRFWTSGSPPSKNP